MSLVLRMKSFHMPHAVHDLSAEWAAVVFGSDFRSRLLHNTLDVKRVSAGKQDRRVSDVILANGTLVIQ